jgi:hypothetical protein
MGLTPEELDRARASGEQIIHVIHHFDSLEVDLTLDTLTMTVNAVTLDVPPISVDIGIPTPTPPKPVVTGIRIVPGTPVHN